MAYIPEEFRQRPREYDPALADFIVERVLNGESLITICEDRDYPMAGTFLQWVSREPELSTAYQEALKIRTDYLVEEMLHVSSDYNVQRAKNQMDARKFHAEKLMPGKYGPRSHTTLHSAEDKDDGGIDYGSEVRRKLEAMAVRIATAGQTAEAAEEPR